LQPLCPISRVWTILCSRRHISPSPFDVLTPVTDAIWSPAVRSAMDGCVPFVLCLARLVAHMEGETTPLLSYVANFGVPPCIDAQSFHKPICGSAVGDAVFTRASLHDVLRRTGTPPVLVGSFLGVGAGAAVVPPLGDQVARNLTRCGRSPPLPNRQCCEGFGPLLVFKLCRRGARPCCFGAIP